MSLDGWGEQSIWKTISKPIYFTEIGMSVHSGLIQKHFCWLVCVAIERSKKKKYSDSNTSKWDFHLKKPCTSDHIFHQLPLISEWNKAALNKLLMWTKIDFLSMAACSIFMQRVEHCGPWNSFFAKSHSCVLKKAERERKEPWNQPYLIVYFKCPSFIWLLKLY